MLESQPLPFMDRVKAAGSVMVTGKLPNPLASEPTNRSRASLVKEYNDWCVEERKFWKPVFDRIRQEQRFAAGVQWIGQKKTTEEIEDYVGDMVQQMVNRKMAALYAKNPMPEAVIRDRLNYEVWDGRQDTIDNCHALVAQVAPQAMQAAEAEQQGQAVPPPPQQMMQDLQQAQAILQDYQRGMQEKALLQKVADTGVALIKQQWDAQSPDLLASAKQAVTRVITSRVAYIKVMYQRDMQTVPTETANTMELSERVATLEARLKAIEAEAASDDDAKLEQARLMKISIQQELAELQQAPEIPSDEGIVLDWLAATALIIDRRCRCLKEFMGAHRIAHELMMTVEECEAKFKISLRDAGARIYSETGAGWQAQDKTDQAPDAKAENFKFGKQKVCVWEIEDKDTGQVYVVCDGVKDFLREPSAPTETVNRFWSTVAITFNSVEVESNDPEQDATIFPRSDVRLMMPMQINVNNAGQEKRKHRDANRPAWVGVKDKFASTAGQNDLLKLGAPRNGHDVLMLEGLQPGDKISDFIQPLPKQPFDENLYENGPDSQAMMLATGQQPSDIGTQRPDEKATGQNIAAQSRATSEGSNVDDLNFAFSTVAQMCWEMLVMEMPEATVKELVGRGAVWPELTRDQIARSIFMKIEAGSMGSPNQQAQLQKTQVVMPQLMAMFQAMGKSPEPLAKMLLKLLDSNIDLDQLLADAEVLPPPPPPQQEQQRPPSVSLSANLADLPPEEQNQAVTKFYGLTAASPASTLLNKVGHGTAVAAHTANNAPPDIAPPTP